MSLYIVKGQYDNGECIAFPCGSMLVEMEPFDNPTFTLVTKDNDTNYYGIDTKWCFTDQEVIKLKTRKEE